MIIRFADLMGKPFSYYGRGPDTFDCLGLAIEIARRRGKILPDVGTYENPDKIDQKMKDHEGLFRILDKPAAWCLATFILKPPFVTHVGTVLPDRVRFIHILPKGNVMIERLDSPCWRHRVRKFAEIIDE